MLKNSLLILGFLVPFLIIYRSLFTLNPLAWGDAPYFYPENLEELFIKPLLWQYRNDNFGADQSSIMWLYIPTFLFGVLNHFLGLNHEVLVKIIFYLPATILSFWGTYFFLGLISKDSLSKFLGSALFSFNTYILMVIDGGQIGVALAYGLFPVVCLLLVKYLNQVTIKNFFLALLGLFIISNVDLRVAIIALVFITILLKFDFVKFKPLFLIMFSNVLLNSFWILPLINDKVFNEGLFSSTSFISLIDSFYLYHPLFPVNEFGSIQTLPVYFIFIPLILFFGLIIGKFRKDYIYLSILFLLFAFLSKGTNPPLGELYDAAINHIPFANAFRDSSKFYIPMLLIAACLLSLSSYNLPKSLKGLSIGIYLYLLFLIFPAVLGNLTGTLGKGDLGDFDAIHRFIREKEGFLRTLWFNEKSSLSFSSWDKPGLSANRLVEERPFASMTDGYYDLFGFLHNNQLSQWLQLLGIKYVFVPGNDRKKIWSERELQERQEFFNFIDQNPSLERVKVTSEFPVYQTKNSNPHIFAQKQAFLIVGGDGVFEKFFQEDNFNLSNQGFIFLEDGKMDPFNLVNLKPSSAVLILDRDRKHLIPLTLQYKMVAPVDAKVNQWANRSRSEYLKWKGELLEKGIRTYEYDFGKGIAFSTQDQEKLLFDTAVKRGGSYYLLTRFTNSPESNGIGVNFKNQEKVLKSNDPTHFDLDIWGPFNLKEGKYEIEFTNIHGLSVLNTFALIGEEELENAKRWTKMLVNRFRIIDLRNESMEGLLENQWKGVEYQRINPTEYKLNLPKDIHWVVFTDHFNPQWVLNTRYPAQVYPFYSMINGFYIDGQETEATLVFSPQKEMNKGIILSGISLLFLCGILILKKR